VRAPRIPSFLSFCSYAREIGVQRTFGGTKKSQELLIINNDMLTIIDCSLSTSAEIHPLTFTRQIFARYFLAQVTINFRTTSSIKTSLTASLSCNIDTFFPGYVTFGRAGGILASLSRFPSLICSENLADSYRVFVISQNWPNVYENDVIPNSEEATRLARTTTFYEENLASLRYRAEGFLCR